MTNDSLRELFPVEAIRDIDPKKYGILVTPAEPTEEPSSEGKREGKTKGRKRGGAKKETVTQQTHQNNKKERANVAFIRGLQETVVEVYRNILACVQAKIGASVLSLVLNLWPCLRFIPLQNLTCCRPSWPSLAASFRLP